MNPLPERIIVYSKDVMNITGRRPRSARKLLEDIRRKNGKDRTTFITLEEFCAYTGLKEEEVRPFMK